MKTHISVQKIEDGHGGHDFETLVEFEAEGEFTMISKCYGVRIQVTPIEERSW